MGWGDQAGKQGAWNFTGPQTKYEIAVSIARLLRKKTKQNKTKYINKYQYNKIFRLVEAVSNFRKIKVFFIFCIGQHL